MTAEKRLYIISLATVAALLVALFAPIGSGRIIAAILLLPAALLASYFIKKRNALSYHAKGVLLIVATIGILYFVFYYVSALHFGFTQTGYGFKRSIILRLISPIAALIVLSEIIRYVFCAQKKKFATAAAYVIGLLCDIVICNSIPGITTFSAFMDMVGLTLYSSLVYNLLYNYLTVRYGYLPNIVYRVLTVLAFYFVPYGSAISDSLLAFFNTLLPVGIYFFIDALYEKKKRFARKDTRRYQKVLTYGISFVAFVIMIGTVMLISNQFSYGALVIATESMTGELDKGDVAIYEGYDDQVITEGQVIVFERNGSRIVHRVVNIEIINGDTRYYTKGDANEDLDAGYVTEQRLVGVVHYRLPFFGYPTLWLRSLFEA